MQDQLNQLDAELAATIDSLVVLRGRLFPVLMPEPPIASSALADRTLHDVPLAEDLCRRRDQVDTAQHIINDILTRLGV